MTHTPYTNRLIKEKSPYLLQHAHNPVDWYPWGEEAFAAARNQDKPIFLSIGYATCHWCHVMERESFELEEIGQLMNKTFISIKVDREELPEVDSLYMEFAQSMMAGSAGWPLNLILTPELEPFFAATYLPPASDRGLMGMRELVQRIEQIWSGDEREQVIDQAQRIVEVFSQGVHTKGDTLPDPARAKFAAEMLFKMADPVYGGMKGAPKFPIGYQGDFLLAYSRATGETRALFLVERTLDMMHRGGIYDHLGGGFSRYSVDEKWLVPHFEKMLYDNAILAHTYLLGWQATKRPLFARVCREILDYVLRDMTHPDGGFYSAEDADSEGVEGLFYTWPMEEVMEAIKSKEDAETFCLFFDVTKHGNFEERNILNTPLSEEEFSIEHDLDLEQLERMLAENRQRLWKIREKRVHPLKDDKVLSAWNGLMIYSFAQAGAAFGNERYIDAAERAARFIKSKLWRGGHLLRRWRDGEASFAAGLDEYSFLIRGALSLFEVGRGSEWLEWAVEMNRILTRDFKDQNGGAFYQTDGKEKNIILRQAQYSDGAEPSGNAVQCENLLKLWRITRDETYRVQAEDILRAVQPFIDKYAPGYTYHLMNLLAVSDKKAPVIVVVLDEKQTAFEDIRTRVFSRYLPSHTVIWVSEGDQTLKKILPYVVDYHPKEGKTTLNICFEGVCVAPVADPTEVVLAIDRL